jgi:pimeloyl-ACP methyl ester carboxylesterase
MRRSLIAFAILAIYFAVMFLAHIVDLLILFPTTAPIETHGAVRQFIPFEQGQLEVWTAKSQIAERAGRPEVFVLRFYGNADRADRWVAADAETWNNRAVEIWGMNYPGFGQSTGPARLSKMGPAALTVFDALKKKAGDRPIILFGASIGTTTALHIAAHRETAGLILHNPPPVREIALRQFGWWNLWLIAGPVALQIPRDLDSIRNAKSIHARAIFLLADRDEIVAPRFQKLVLNAYAGEKRVIPLPGSSHNSPIEGEALAELHQTLDWLLPRDANATKTESH